MTVRHRPRRLATTLRVAAGSVVCLAVTTTLAPGALASPFSDGQWYATSFKLADNHTVADGTGITVAVLDGVFSPTAPSLAGADVTPPQPSGCTGSDGSTAVTGTTVRANHATQMVSMIAGQGGSDIPLGVAPGSKVLVYTIGIGTDTDPALVCGDGRNADQVTGDAITDAVAKGARVISMSFSGDGSQPATQTAILFGERKGVVFVASTDDSADATGSRLREPAVFNGVVAVNGIDKSAAIVPNSATGNPDGPLVVAAGPGNGLSLGAYRPGGGGWDSGATIGGSSPATAFVAGALAVTASKWPDATGNQLIQSLARNTGGEEHEIDQRALDGYGYGVVSLTSMLAHDPTAYPDENPVLRDDADPSTSDILEGSSTAPSSPTSGAPSTGTGSPVSSPPTSSTSVAAPDDGGSSTGLIIGIVVGVVVLAGVVLVVVLLSRRNRRPGPPPPAAGPPPGAPPGYGVGGR